jgi:hypothetical protein
MAKGTPLAAQQNDYYPSKFKTGDLHDDFRRLYDHVYQQRRTNDDLRKRLEAMESKHGKLAEDVANGPSTTKIAGLFVKGTVPTNGQKLTYNATTGQIEWQ